MQSLRRAALRSALSASRVATVKTSTAPFVSTIAKVAVASRISPLQAVRWYSQENSETDVQEAAQEATEEAAPVAQEEQGNVRDKPAAFVRNLVFEVTENHLKEAFATYGEVVDTFIARDPRGMSRGYGFVTFDTKEALDAACAAVDGSFWHGRRVTCVPREHKPRQQREEREKPKSNPSTQLFVGNIPYETTDAELNRLFSELENVSDVRIAVDRTTGWPRGFAHIDFADVDAAKAGLEKLSQVQIGDRKLRVDFASGYQKNSSGVGGRGDRGDRGDRGGRRDQRGRRGDYEESQF
ncbi:hypothetical protein QBC35DRAFT_497563 [Podospora australis]|uniref:RRM domain-containing protein n=1 Tax=Podospora australis TaxID=1536484 RepID=A0AAN6WWY5_9PEZI|nr:hypothetical protein QBC35DRAFT_497563 [Podospora australis]